nr:helix-turn-helix transcriptional regulator [Coprococcus comes]
MTFKKYLLQQRMEKAKRLIQDGCESIGTVCEQVGISNASCFSHLFKEYTGKLPSEYKKDYEE